MKINRFFRTFDSAFNLSLEASDGDATQPTRVDPMVRVTHEWMKSTANWPTNIIPEDVTSANGITTIQTSIVPDGKFRYCFAATVVFNEAVARRTFLEMTGLIMPASGMCLEFAVLNGAAADAGDVLPLRRAVLIPSACRLQARLDGIGAGARVRLTALFAEYNMSDSHPNM
jgi:hypothetical protein